MTMKSMRAAIGALFLAGCLGATACGRGGSDSSGSPGAGGSAQTGGSGGTSETGGTAGSGGTAGTGGSGGDDGGLGGTGGSQTGGTGGNAGTGGTGGSAGMAGSAGTGGTGGGPTCTDKCTDNITQCVGAQVQTCTVQSNGCTDWNAPEVCPNNKACNAGQCPSCTDNCTYNATQCNGAQVETCTTQANGCTDWAAPADCPYGKACVAGACPVCVDKCVVNTTQCNGAQVQTCAVQANGCTDWDAPANCANGKACLGNACPTCTDACTLNNTQCNGTQVQTCSMQSDGCTNWAPPQSCASGKACTNGVCPTCTDACTLNATQCSGSQVQTCAVQTSGCTDWSAPADCPNNGVCQGTQCVTACTPGSLRCNGSLLETCTSSHQWMTQQVCSQSCDPQTLQCVTSTTCAPGARRCSGLQSQVCNSTGTAWLNVESCLVACDNGLCTGACTPGATRCNGMTPETCNSTGTAWTQGTACTTFCYNGACAEPSLTIDADANKTLDGEHVYSGDVVIKNSSVLTVPTGKLIIRAKNVILDASSKIVVQPVGNDPRGKGMDGGSTSCSYVCTGYGTVGGGGGGFGVAGTTASQTFGCYYYSSYYTCGVSRTGGSVYAIADDELTVGSPGGACSGTSGGNGGGYLAIFADSITIQGQITANGQNATGCAGGGSGGEVLLRATSDLTFTGSISAAGGLGGGSNGAGNGGNGVVKLLYGDTKTLTGSVVGAQFSSFMPPDDLTSSTHPRQSLWYNDSYSSLDMAWSKPFSTSAGYYRKENTTYGFVPNSSNANYQSGEAISYQPTDLAPGTNYFHIATLGPFATMGTVESRFVVNINVTPPTVSSSSHPSQTTWYPNDSPYLTWTLPHADENTTNFYWVFDAYQETLPTTTDNKIPMDLVTPQNSKQILLPGKANGIWFFHLISQDTMGYLTKQAALFRVQIGTDPGKGSVSGTVTDGQTSAFLQNVQISLNRGVYSTTTNSTGAYALTNSVYAQSYEIRARLAGYQDAVQTVNVVANQTATVNFVLQHQ